MISRRFVSRLAIVLLAAFVVLLCGITVAHAQDNAQADENAQDSAQAEDDSDGGTWDRCMDNHAETDAIRNLVRDGRLEVADGDRTLHDVYAPEMFENAEDKRAIQEEVERLQNEDSVNASLGRNVNRGLCGVSYPFAKVGDTVSDQVSKFWKDPVGKFTKAVLEGNMETFQWAMTFWMDTDTGGANPDRNIAGVKNIVYAAAGFGLIASFIFGGMRMAANRRMGLQDGLEDQGEVMLKWLLFSIAIPAFAPAAIVASDRVAEAIMSTFGATDPEQMSGLIALEENTAGPVVMLALGLICLAGSVMQLIALVTRILVFPLVVGLMPLFASFSFSQRGKQGLDHLVAYGIAIILFKPVAALLYCVVMWNANQSDGGDLMTAGINALMIALAGFTAPALMKALVPAVAQAGGGGGAAIMAGAAGAAGAAGGAIGAAAGSVGKAAGKAASGGNSAGGAGNLSGGGGSGFTGSGAGPGSGGPAGGGGGSSPSGGGGGRSGGGGGRSGGGGSSPSGGGSTAAGAGSGSTQRASGGGARRSPVGASASHGSRGRPGSNKLRTRAASATRMGAGLVGSAGRGLRGSAQAVGAGAQRTQSILDDSVGVQGSYAGQVHR